jgi:hypothetical protein
VARFVLLTRSLFFFELPEECQQVFAFLFLFKTPIWLHLREIDIVGSPFGVCSFKAV